MANATIIAINLPSDKAIAVLDNGDYVWLELLGKELNISDEIIADFYLYPLGQESVKIVSTGESVDIVIENYSNKNQAISYLNA